jgi:transposase
VARARALLAVADGHSYGAAAQLVGRHQGDTIARWVSCFNREGPAGVVPHHGGGPRVRYGDDQRQRILAEFARTPDRERDGTATWSLATLRTALCHADDGLPGVSTFTLWRTLRDAGLSWQKDRTWCVTGVAVRRRKKDGVVSVTDPDADAKKA